MVSVLPCQCLSSTDVHPSITYCKMWIDLYRTVSLRLCYGSRARAEGSRSVQCNLDQVRSYWYIFFYLRITFLGHDTCKPFHTCPTIDPLYFVLGYIWFLTRVDIGTRVTLAHRRRRNRHHCYLIKSDFLPIWSLSLAI